MKETRTKEIAVQRETEGENGKTQLIAFGMAPRGFIAIGFVKDL